MTELGRRDMQWLPVVAAQPGGGGGVVESVAEPVGAQASAAFGEQEVCWPIQAGVAVGTLASTLGYPFVEGGKRCGIEWNSAFGAEFTEWHFQPTAVAR